MKTLRVTGEGEESWIVVQRMMGWIRVMNGTSKLDIDLLVLPVSANDV